MKILIFIDELSSSPTKDEEDTLQEANEVRASLIKFGHEVFIASFNLNLYENLKTIDIIKPNLIFNLVETFNKGNTLHIAPLIFEQKQIKFSGGSSFALFITSNKILTKDFLKGINIKTPSFYYSNIGIINPILIEEKVIIKPIDEEASCGIDDNSVTLFDNYKMIKSYIKNNPLNFIENYIEGDEYSISVMKINSKVVILPIAKMEFINYPNEKPKILNYKSKWDESSYEYKNTQRVFIDETKDSPLFKEMKSICKKCYKKLGSKGYLRIDFKVDKNNIPYVIDININPCITHDSGFVAAANKYGLTYDELINTIINEAINE
jgi:D-alanine-D-alanine ligase